MNAVERAADVIRSATWHASGSQVLTVVPLDAAQALADAGLLVTDELQAEADRAVADLRAANAELRGAIRALRTIIPEWATNTQRWLDDLIARNSFDDEDDWDVWRDG